MIATTQRFQEDMLSPIHSLEGRTLKTGWKVLRKAAFKPGSTGGNFSVCYIVEKDGQEGFLKALNVLAFLTQDEDLIAALGIMTNAYEYERQVLERCRDRNLSKVSKLLETSYENIPGFLLPNVYYMIFEKADGDVRNHLNFAAGVDFAWKLRSLHHIATGIKQLHSIEISHQDIKPSNVFVFNNKVSKLGDLGRSMCNGLNSPHSGRGFAGDPKYAPIEAYYRFELSNWKDKVFATDCYMLGSMATFYFCGQGMTAMISSKIDPHINILTLGFENALAYFIAAFDEVLQDVKRDLGNYEYADKLVEAIKMLCYPDPRKRGHPKSISGMGNNFQLERFVETFNFLARKAEYKLNN
jgi:serine/threonine protein kinase